MLSIYIILLCGIVSAARTSAPYIDSPFPDPYSRVRFTLNSEKIASWPQFPLGVTSPTQLISIPGSSLLLLATDSIWISGSLGTDWERVDATLFGKGVIRSSCRIHEIGSSFWGLFCSEFVAVVKFESGLPLGMKVIGSKTLEKKFGDVLDVGFPCPAGENLYELFVGGTEGLFLVRVHIESGEISIKAVRENVVVQSVAVLPISGELCSVAFASESLHRVFVFDSGEAFDPEKWWFYWIRNSVEDEATALEFDVSDGSLYIGSQYALNVLDGEREIITRVGGIEGLPFGNITTILSTKYRTFFGLTHGVAAYDSRDAGFHFFSGDRFAHGSVVRSLSLADPTSPDGSGGVIVVTESGGGIIDWKHWTLQQKAAHYEAMVEPRHDRFGLVSDVGLKAYGDLTTYYKRSSDNDGLWTSVYLDGEIFRYAVTNSSEARERVWKHFGALEFLATVSGLRGFPARSILPVGAPIPGGEWFNSPIHPDFQFKADTSSDEIIGHMLSYHLMYELVAETQAEKSRVAELVDAIAGNIVSHDFYLLDFNSSHPTTWGKWNWKWLNDGGDDWDTWANNRGLNSLEILGMILSAYYMTGNEMYFSAYRKLANDHGYARNIINTKIMSPDNANHSDDELESLATLLLHLALTKLKDSEFDELRANLKKCVVRTHGFIERERSSMFDPVYAVVAGDSSFDPSVVAWTLKTWPQDLITWPVENSFREDVRLNPEPRIRNILSVNERMKLLPYNELSMYRWNGDPHSLNGGSGYQEYDPGAWVFGYWMSRYYGLFQSN